jgi:hypothetical protein
MRKAIFIAAAITLIFAGGAGQLFAGGGQEEAGSAFAPNQSADAYIYIDGRYRRTGCGQR